MQLNNTFFHVNRCEMQNNNCHNLQFPGSSQYIEFQQDRNEQQYHQHQHQHQHQNHQQQQQQNAYQWSPDLTSSSRQCQNQYSNFNSVNFINNNSQVGPSGFSDNFNFSQGTRVPNLPPRHSPNLSYNNCIVNSTSGSTFNSIPTSFQPTLAQYFNDYSSCPDFGSVPGLTNSWSTGTSVSSQRTTNGNLEMATSSQSPQSMVTPRIRKRKAQKTASELQLYREDLKLRNRDAARRSRARKAERKRLLMMKS